MPNGVDGLLFRGTLLLLVMEVMERGMHTLLARVGVRLLDFKRYALGTSEAVKDASLQEAVAESGRSGRLPTRGSHGSGRARLAHPALQVMGLLRNGNPVVHPICYPWESR